MNKFACGSFSSQMADDFDDISSPCLSPRKSRKNRDSKNPFANRGLDKFSALLAELEDKKREIYTQKGSNDISFVRFVYSNSDDWKPIVVKAKDNKKQDQENFPKMTKKPVAPTLEKKLAENNEVEESKVEIREIPQKKSTKKLNWRFNLEKLRCQCFYLPVMIALIMVFLAIFGRSFAIICTSVGWYLIPMISSKDGMISCPTSKRSKKKEYIRRFSEKTTVHHEGSSSPRSTLSCPSSPVNKHGHKLSW